MKTTTVKKLIFKGARFARKYLPIALGMLAGYATVKTAVEAVKSAKDNEEQKLVDEYIEETGCEPCKIDKAILIVKANKKAFIFGAITFMSMGLSIGMLWKRQKDLSNQIQSLSTLLARYGNAAMAAGAVEGAKRINQQNPMVIYASEDLNEDENWFYDPYTETHFHAKLSDVLRTINACALAFERNGYVSVNQFYNELGCDDAPRGFEGFAWALSDNYYDINGDFCFYMDCVKRELDDGLTYYELVVYSSFEVKEVDTPNSIYISGMSCPITNMPQYDEEYLYYPDYIY